MADDIKLEIEISTLDLKNAREKVSVARETLSQAEENMRVFRARYNAGNATSTEVLEAIALEERAQTNYYRGDYELKRAYARLMYSQGNELASIYRHMETKQ